MTRCLDEAMLQTYFDGELSIEMMESVTSHLAACESCAAAARELEEETAFLTSALAAEFEASVPTERLRERIDAAVLGERLTHASTQRKHGVAGFLAGLLDFGAQRTLGYASLAMVVAFAAIFGIVKMRMDDTNVAVAPPAPAPALVQPDTRKGTSEVAANNPPVVVPVKNSVSERRNNSLSPRPVKVSLTNSAPKPATVKLIPGERSYLQAIARLDSTIKSGKQSMRPSLQVEYERNLAVVDRAIAATRSAAKSNPNDPDAADFMFAAYQSKVDLLNTIADARLGGGRGH